MTIENNKEDQITEIKEEVANTETTEDVQKENNKEDQITEIKEEVVDTETTEEQDNPDEELLEGLRDYFNVTDSNTEEISKDFTENAKSLYGEDGEEMSNFFTSEFKAILNDAVKKSYEKGLAEAKAKFENKPKVSSLFTKSLSKAKQINTTPAPTKTKAEWEKQFNESKFGSPEHKQAMDKLRELAPKSF